MTVPDIELRVEVMSIGPEPWRMLPPFCVRVVRRNRRTYITTVIARVEGDNVTQLIDYLGPIIARAKAALEEG